MRACSVKRSIKRRRGAYHSRCVAFAPNLGALRMHPTGDLQHARGMVRRCGAGVGNVRGMATEEAAGVRDAALDASGSLRARFRPIHRRAPSRTGWCVQKRPRCSATVHKTMCLSHPVRCKAAAPDRHPFSSGFIHDCKTEVRKMNAKFFF